MKPFVSYPNFQPSQNELKGYLFEQWVVKQFHSHGFILLEWRSDKEVDGIFPLSSKKPDLVVALTSDNSKYYYAIECKWRKDIGKGIYWASKKKIDEYQEFSTKMQTKVYIAVGIGGSPSNSAKTYLIPLDSISNSNFISADSINDYSWPKPTNFLTLFENYNQHS